jgi:hypothetical protein
LNMSWVGELTSFVCIVWITLARLFFFCGTGIWIQGLHLEPLHQSYFVFFSWWVFLR